MKCPCWPSKPAFSAVAQRAGETALLMLGVPDYDAYLQHMAERHPLDPPLDRAAFFRARQSARYAAGGLRCC